jgi:hypothetical protein
MTYDTFKTQMAGLAVLFKEPMDTDRWQLVTDLYWAFFAAWPDEQFQVAARRYALVGTFFPKPSDLIAQGSVAELTGEEAWVEVYGCLTHAGRSRQWSHPAIAHAVDGIGWETLERMEFDQVPTIRAQFVKMFAAYRTRAEEAHWPALRTRAESTKGLTQIGTVLPMLEKPMS